MIAIIDYGAGNLMSVKKAFDFIGAENIITADPDIIEKSDGVVLPGVGAFGDAMDCMRKSNLIETTKKAALSGKPFLGICLGLHLLFEGSDEAPGVEGLKLFKGRIHKIPGNGLKVPHMGWNSIKIVKDNPLFKGIPDNSYVYFVHSFYLEAEDREIVSSTTDYSVNIHASIAKDNVFAAQFHPEKSGDVGIKMLRNFVSLCGGENNVR